MSDDSNQGATTPEVTPNELAVTKQPANVHGNMDGTTVMQNQREWEAKHPYTDTGPKGWW